ncbi:hypothetical protein DPMN_150037 [Dreissena polymorpha]|uniref:Uncharacterized protein n=1 Tax=Dreissena polymorpha TaxID=45954 RepID=A0A9D4FEY5_DREPO|nr:hypothetical protein DPMN_150037 [Dreissena polymorpha]
MELTILKCLERNCVCLPGDPGHPQVPPPPGAPYAARGRGEVWGHHHTSPLPHQQGWNIHQPCKVQIKELAQVSVTIVGKGLGSFGLGKFSSFG